MSSAACAKTVYKFSKQLVSKDGFMVCEELRLCDLQQALATELVRQPSPFYAYSKAAIQDNITAYRTPLEQCCGNYLLGYSMKANCNPTILELFREAGLTAVTVSGHEIELALRAGFPPENIVSNGNGKQRWEIDVALKNRCLINVDSEFDLRHISERASALGLTGRILLRINPDIDPDVHPFVATGLSASKFGVEEGQVTKVLLALIKGDPCLELVGLHCHLGSTIDNTSVFRECVEVMLSIVDHVKQEGFTLKYLNIGGGLGIDYRRHSWRTSELGRPSNPVVTFPSPSDLIGQVKDELVNRDLCLILEPGRSLIGSAVTLVTTVIGCKSNGKTNYLVVDGSMTDLLRPSLYGAYHHIELTEPSQDPEAPREKYDVVGPVCEGADFLGKDRWLTRPHEGCGLAVLDSGAYCGSMASNYNMRMRAAEVLVDGREWRIIRYPDTPEDILAVYPDYRRSSDHAKTK